MKNRHTERKTDVQKEKQTHRKKDRRTERKTDLQKERPTQRRRRKQMKQKHIKTQNLGRSRSTDIKTKKKQRLMFEQTQR